MLCENVTCGVNAECVVSNHAAACECDAGFLANPDAVQGCARCTQNSDCNSGSCKCKGINLKMYIQRKIDMNLKFISK